MALVRVTILGASGFIGSHLMARLAGTSWDVWAPDRSADLTQRPLGHVIDCEGVTADARYRPYDTVEAHVCRVQQLVTACEFDSVTYLSSTRMYKRNAGVAGEDDLMLFGPTLSEDLYDISKALGECLLLASGRPARIVRLSNVYGVDRESTNFLPSLITEAVRTGVVRLETHVDSAKDYVSIEDVVEMIPRIAIDATRTVYNIASGVNVSNGQLAEVIARELGAEIRVEDDAPAVRHPLISIERLTEEFRFRPRLLLDDLPALVAAYVARQVPE